MRKRLSKQGTCCTVRPTTSAPIYSHFHTALVALAFPRFICHVRIPALSATRFGSAVLCGLSLFLSAEKHFHIFCQTKVAACVDAHDEMANLWQCVSTAMLA